MASSIVVFAQFTPLGNFFTAAVFSHWTARMKFTTGRRIGRAGDFAFQFLCLFAVPDFAGSLRFAGKANTRLFCNIIKLNKQLKSESCAAEQFGHHKLTVSKCLSAGVPAIRGTHSYVNQFISGLIEI